MTESITQELREVFLEYMDKVDALARENVQLNNIIIDGRAENERLIQECRNVDKYKKALEDIREMIKADCKMCTAECDCDDDCTRYKIKTKINEVLQ